MRKLTFSENHRISGGNVIHLISGFILGSYFIALYIHPSISSANEKLKAYRALYGDLPSQSNITAA